MKSVRWDEMKRSMERAIKTNWSLFKQSKLGMVGLAIITFFIVIAIFAPVIPFTYSPTYLAPAGDLFEIDNYTKTIPTQENWHSPVSVLTPRTSYGKNSMIAGVLLYSSSGKSYFYPRDFSNTTLLRLYNPISRDIPVGMKDMMYLKENTKIIGVTNNSMYMYSVRFHRNLEDVVLDSFLKNPTVVHLPYHVQYFSNVWDYNVTVTSNTHALVAIALAGDHNVTIFMWEYLVANMGGLPYVVAPGLHFVYNFTVNSTIEANPQIRFDTANGHTWVIVPTKSAIEKYNILLKYNYTGGEEKIRYVDGISGKQLDWKYSLDSAGEQLAGSHSVSLVYAQAGQGIKKSRDVVVILCKNNYALGIFANNGTLAWNNTISLNPMDPRIHTLNVIGLHGTIREFTMIYGTTNVGSFVAKLDPSTGMVMDNRTSYLVLKGDINYVSQYDQGARSYYVSTKQGSIYEISEQFRTELMGGVRGIGLNKSFMILGGAATPAVYLGTVFPMSGQTGTYIGVVTKQNTLYLQASGGSRIPTVVIPPFGHGRYSGNFYLFGTDYEGHDIWTWLVYGARTSLLVGLTAAIISVLAGTFIGIISGFYGGWIDIVIMRTVDIILTLPGIVIMLLLAAVLGPNIWNIVLIISVLGWAGIARVIRAVTLSLKNRPFMDAARVAGASNVRMITVHIFPNVLPLTFLYMTFGVAGAILSEAALAFLGLGDPNSISWGMMLQYLRMYAQQTNPNAWGWLVMPGVFITLISLSFYLVGRAFDEIVNPRLRKR